MPIVRLVGDGEPDAQEVSISLKNSPAVIADIRRALPKLKRDMRKKWPTLSDVEIRHRLPRLKNPVDATHYTLNAAWLVDARLILVAIFSSQVAAEFAKEVIKPPAREIGEYLRRWVQKFTKPKSRRRTKHLREKH